MMKVAYGALAGALGLVAGAASAQTTVAQPMATQIATLVTGPANPNVLRAGTPVPMKMREALTTNGKKLKPGQRFQLEVAENVLLNGVTVIPAGSPAVGEVTDVRNKGMWGKSGRINARVLYANVNGRQVRMTGVFDDKGTTGTAGVVGAIAVLPIAGFFVTGTSANIAMGAPISAFVDEDIPVAFSTAPANPMVVTAPAPAMTPPGPQPTLIKSVTPVK